MRENKKKEKMEIPKIVEKNPFPILFRGLSEE